MAEYSRRDFLRTAAGAVGTGAIGVGASGVGTGTAWAGPFPAGVESTASALVSGDERSRQTDIWALEVHFKPVRMEYVDLPVPGGTGATQKTLVWYLCYRAVNRLTLGATVDETPAEQRPLFVPELTLVTESDDSQKVYFDRVIPVAQRAILARERHPYKNSVEIVGPIPPQTPPGSKTEQSLDGLAIWRGVDPKTRRFKVFFSGFSNGYQVVAAPDGESLIQRKTLVQSFWRPADEFDQKESEIRIDGGAKWVYR
jgi:hypothetical protein